MKYQWVSRSMAIIKKPDNAELWQGYRATEILIPACCSVNRLNHFGKLIISNAY